MYDKEHERINNKIEKAAKNLYKDFVSEEYRDWWWKEEDLHAHLYHQLIQEKGLSPERVFREYRLITEKTGDESWQKRSIGDVDLVILEPTESEFSLENCKVSHAIEIKFARDLKDNGKVFTDSTQRRFAKSFFRDYGKLWFTENEPANVVKNFEKYILVFEKFSSSKSGKSRLFSREPEDLFENPLEDYKKIEDRIKKEKDIEDLEKITDWPWLDDKNNWQEFKKEKFRKMKFSYVEVGSNGNNSPVLIKWSERPEKIEINSQT